MQTDEKGFFFIEGEAEGSLTHKGFVYFMGLQTLQNTVAAHVEKSLRVWHSVDRMFHNRRVAKALAAAEAAKAAEEEN